MNNLFDSYLISISQKWLKDREDRTLTNQEIEHYQKIIVALTETDRKMKEIKIIKQ